MLAVGVQGLTSAVLWKAFWCWLENGRGRGTPEQAGGGVTGQVGIQAGQTGHWIWQRDRNGALLGPACWQEGWRQACLGCANCDTQAVDGVAHLGLSSPRPAG